jgi:uracil-DNA glycosylase
MMPEIPPAWRPLLAEETSQNYFRDLRAFLEAEDAAGAQTLPAREDIFNALALTPPDAVKVLLVGQDPYPTPGHAHGLCFSVRPGVRPLPRSLTNVFKELRDDVGFRLPNHGCLESWARQGVLLLNTVLTVRAGEAGSHRGRGWERFTDRIIALVNAQPRRVVFVLWGRDAQKKLPLITGEQHRVVACAHPSPLSARLFFGSRCFSKINQHLVEAGAAPIDWTIPDE